jgi:uncharacterized protein (DUF2267 family)
VGSTPQGIVTPERGKADKVRARYNAEVEQIRGQRNLSDAGRRARLAQAVVKARADLDRLRAEEADRVAGRRDQIIHEFFGHNRPNDSRIISIRDAADRAGRVKTPDDAADLMNRAEQSGDDVLLRALARECAGRRSPLEPEWHNLFQTWVRQQPGGPEALDELAIIGDETTDSGHRLHRERAFGLPQLPREIAGIGNLKVLADQADSIAELPPSRGEQVGKHLSGMVLGTME